MANLKKMKKALEDVEFGVWLMRTIMDDLILDIEGAKRAYKARV